MMGSSVDTLTNVSLVVLLTRTFVVSGAAPGHKPRARPDAGRGRARSGQAIPLSGTYAGRREDELAMTVRVNVTRDGDAGDSRGSGT